MVGDSWQPDVKETAERFADRISSRTSIRPITTKIAMLADQLPQSYASDPCDRLLGRRH